MAKLVSLATLVGRLESRCDIANDQSVSLAEKQDLINQGLQFVWDELTAETPPDYALTTASPITTVAGTALYDLPSDFLKMRVVQVDEGSGRRRSLDEMQPELRLFVTEPLGGSVVYCEYIPVCPTLVLDADTINGVNGWEELAVLWAALRVFAKKKWDPDVIVALYEREKARIEGSANRDAGTAPRIHRTSFGHMRWPWWTQTLTHYRIRGSDKLELWRANPSWP
jgi:hypothetical protein